MMTLPDASSTHSIIASSRRDGNSGYLTVIRLEMSRQYVVIPQKLCDHLHSRDQLVAIQAMSWLH